MIELDRKVLAKNLRRQRDAMLREAILASIKRKGEPDEYFIINYLIDRLLPDKGLQSFFDIPLDDRIDLTETCHRNSLTS